MGLRLRAFVPLVVLAISALLSLDASAEERKHRRSRRQRNAESAQASDSASGATDTERAAAVNTTTTQAPSFVYKDREGRTVFTNLETSVQPADPHILPDPYSFDIHKLSAEELTLLNAHLEEVADAMQSGERCEALRGASRISTRTWITREHERELLVAGGLFVFALTMAVMWSSRWLKSLLPISPFVACVYLAYYSYAESEALREDIGKGLRACSTSLESGSATQPKLVHERLLQAWRMRTSIDDAFEQRNGAVERAMSQYQM